MAEFTATDSEGVVHHYRMAKVPVRQGARFARRILGGAVKPLARALTHLDNAQAAAMTRTDPSDTKGLLDALDGLDLSSLAGDVGEVIETLDTDALIDLFAYVTRDGTPLDEDVTLDAAYAGNWGEFYAACYHVVMAQGFLSFIVTSSRT